MGSRYPQFFQALVTYEVFKSVLLEFVHTGADGKEEVFQTVKLSNAGIEKIEQSAGILRDPANANKMDIETISMTFQRIEIENKAGKTIAADDWIASK